MTQQKHNRKMIFAHHKQNFIFYSFESHLQKLVLQTNYYYEFREKMIENRKKYLQPIHKSKVRSFLHRPSDGKVAGDAI